MTKRTVVRRILVDIDSTIYPIIPLISKHLAALYGVQMPESAFTSFAFHELAGLTAEHGLRVIEACQTDAEILAQHPYPGVVETLQAWAARGVEIHVVSDRRVETGPATIAWLNRIGVPRVATVLAAGIDKFAYARSNDLELIIDDKPDLIKIAADAGVPVATLTLPYNAEMCAQLSAVISAPDWPTLRRRIERRHQIGTPAGRRTRSSSSAPSLLIPSSGSAS